MDQGFFIAGRPVGGNAPPFVIAEIGQAHDGSLGTAHAYVDAVADAGVDAVKFQTHIAEAESTLGEPWRVRFSPQDATRYDYWKRMELPPDAWRGLRDHAHERGLVFLSTPFSHAAVALLERLEVPAWKVGSGEITNLPLLRRLAATGRPILLSSGMSSWAELDAAVEAVPGPRAIFQCTSKYPCPPREIGLNVLGELRARYGCPVGLSDHSATVHAGIAAVALGADLLEVHAVFDRRCFGPDTAASLTIDEIAELVRGARLVHEARIHPVDKDEAARRLDETKRLFEKSVVLLFDAPVGHLLTRSDLAFKKPGTGIPAREHERVLGRRLKSAVLANTPLTEEDLDVE